MARIDKTQRMAAGYVLLGIFHTSNSVAASLDSIRRYMRKGMTEKELLFLDKRYTRFREEGEILRQLAWRLIRSA